MTAPRPIAGELRKPLARALSEGHPWVYRDAIALPRAPPGAVVTVVEANGKFVARGFAEAGPIAVRILTLDPEETVDAALFARRIAAAADLRTRVVPPETDAYRLVHGEGDRLPGVVCDVYADHAVLQFDGEGVRVWKDAIVGALDAALRARGVETLLFKTGRQAGRRVDALRGTVPSDAVAVRERGMRLFADLVHGQKTGLFLDHRESRARVRTLAAGARVLNLYGYTGAFSVAAGLGGAAHVTTIDVAEAALALAQRTWEANGLAPAAHDTVARDVPETLHELLTASTRYDLVIADPPSFAPNERARPAALRSYRALHASALRLLRPGGGLYLAASCSSHVDRPAFEGTLREAALDVGRVVQVLDRWGAPPDHPRLLAFPEGDYLKVVLVRA